jgi:hypothetical protein
MSGCQKTCWGSEPPLANAMRARNYAWCRLSEVIRIRQHQKAVVKYTSHTWIVIYRETIGYGVKYLTRGR